MALKLGYLLLLVALATSMAIAHGKLPNGSKHYVVIHGKHNFPHHNAVVNANHEQLASLLGSMELAQKSTVYHYTKAFRGFSAVLTPEQAENLKQSGSAIVVEDTSYKMTTVRSWDFMEKYMLSKRYQTLNITAHKFHGSIDSENLSSQLADSQLLPSQPTDVVIGHFDSGIWPEALSFSDEGFNDPPQHFKGDTCKFGGSFQCNNKILSGKYFYKGWETIHGPLQNTGRSFFRSARDDDGHGTHTASTAAGARIARQNIPGVGRYTMRGGAPGARLAIYKTCWFGDCRCSDILMAYDEAINDRVDIINLSIGDYHPQNLQNIFEDCHAVGAFQAFTNGIVVSSAAGNDGKPYTVSNQVPWTITSAASTIDRAFDTTILLGDMTSVVGRGLNFEVKKEFLSLRYGPSVQGPNTTDNYEAAKNCEPAAMNLDFVYRAIVMCNSKGEKEDEVTAGILAKANATGVIFILSNDHATRLGSYLALQHVSLDRNATIALANYFNHKDNIDPVAMFTPSHSTLHVDNTPQIASFSSKGPNFMLPSIIKPDITAPGVNIIAAVPFINEISPRSGTSMATSHTTAVAAMIKARYPSWSPAAIASAIMTTGFNQNIDDNPIITSNGLIATPFDMGSGYLNPDHAVDPGLVYDYNNWDLKEFLCGYRLTDAALQGLFNPNVTCLKPRSSMLNLNYPSISVTSETWPVNITRTLTYVGGEHKSMEFAAEIVMPPGGFKVEVSPATLGFHHVKTASYVLTVTPPNGRRMDWNTWNIGSITWKNGDYRVYSPIAINY